jgi:hypothetical protein
MTPKNRGELVGYELMKNCPYLHFIPANRLIVALLRCHLRVSLSLSAFNSDWRPDLFANSLFSFSV